MSVGRKIRLYAPSNRTDFELRPLEHRNSNNVFTSICSCFPVSTHARFNCIYVEYALYIAVYYFGKTAHTRCTLSGSLDVLFYGLDARLLRPRKHSSFCVLYLKRVVFFYCLWHLFRELRVCVCLVVVVCCFYLTHIQLDFYAIIAKEWQM